MQFEKNLGSIRRKCGMSQEELAFAVGVSRQTIYAWESGISYPNILMLKKIAEVLRVKTDDLLNGFGVTAFPAEVDRLELTALKEHEGEVYYEELPNWFIRLRADAEVNWALYDVTENGYARDYSYHVSVTGKAKVHDLDCLEIEVTEYKPDFDFSRSYHQYISVTEEGVAWAGESAFRDGKRVIRTFKDQSFLDDWGCDKRFAYAKMRFDRAEDAVLEFGGEKRRVIRITYFDPDGSDDPKRAFFEVILDQNAESLAWRRYTRVDAKKEPSGRSIRVENRVYDMDYIALTSRIL